MLWYFHVAFSGGETWQRALCFIKVARAIKHIINVYTFKSRERSTEYLLLNLFTDVKKIPELLCNFLSGKTHTCHSKQVNCLYIQNSISSTNSARGNTIIVFSYLNFSFWCEEIKFWSVLLTLGSTSFFSATNPVPPVHPLGCSSWSMWGLYRFLYTAEDTELHFLCSLNWDTG